MAIKGKGVFRIALEDFFTTTKIGVWVSSWFVQFGELLEDMIAGHYRDIFSDIANDPSLPESLRALAKGSGNSSNQGGIGQAIGFAVGTGTQASGSFLAPLFKTLEYKMNKKVKPYRLDPQSVIAAIWRTPEFIELLKGDRDDLGVSNDRDGILRELMRPRPNENSMIEGWIRGIIPDDALEHELKARGWEPNSISLFMKLRQTIPPVSDLLNMAVREAFSPDVVSRFKYDEAFPGNVLEFTKKQGLSEEWVRRYWYAHWNLPSPQQGYEMLHRLRPDRVSNPFTKDDLDLLLRTADYAPYFRDKLIAISYAPFTRVDVRRMYKTGELSYEEVIEAYKDIGYDDTRAKLLADFTVNYETGESSNLIDEYSELSRNLVQSAYSSGVITEDEFRQALEGMKIVGKAQDLVVKITELKRQIDKIPDFTKEYRNDLKTLTEKAYAARMIDKVSAITILEGIDITSEQASMMLANADLNYTYSTRSDIIGVIGKAYVSRAIDRSAAITHLGTQNVTGAEQSQIMLEWDTQREFRTKRLTQTQYQKAYQNEIITLDEYKDALQGLDYSDKDITILLAFVANATESGF